MPVDKHPKIQAALENAVNTLDIDGVLYRLMEIAYAKRNAEDHKDGNKAEYRYWHQVAGILSDTTDKIGEVS